MNQEYQTSVKADALTLVFFYAEKFSQERGKKSGGVNKHYLHSTLRSADNTAQINFVYSRRSRVLALIRII